MRGAWLYVQAMGDATLGGYGHWPMSLVARNLGGGDLATGTTLEACPAWATGEALRAAAIGRRCPGWLVPPLATPNLY